MAMLGSLLADAQRSAGIIHESLRATDPVLADEVEARAAADGTGIATFMRRAVSDFSRSAGEEDWATLMSWINGSEDPGAACLTAMIRWRLAAPTCAEHDLHPYPGGAENDGKE